MASNCGTLPSTRTEILERFQNGYLRIIVNASWYVTNDTLRHDLNVPHVRDEIKRLKQRYADRMEEHSNILGTNLIKKVKTTCRLKKNYLKIHVSDGTVIL